MKKFILFFLFFTFFALNISNLFAQQMTYTNLRDGNGISIGVKLDSYDITPLSYKSETMHEISLSGIFLPNDEGMPNLPRISRFVAVPKGAEVKISLKRMETQTVQNINVAPALRIQAIPEEPVMDYIKSERVYEANEFYPQNILEISDVTSLRGVSVVVVGITPFQFNPITKELIVITNIELELEYIGGSREYDDPKYRSPWFDPILRNALLNYEVLEDIEYTPQSARNGTGCEYLIVIPNRDDFRPYAEQIKEFRTKQGIYTKIMRLDEMPASNTTQIKQFFHNAYNTWDIPPVAVLLMGDHISSTNLTQGIPAETINHPYSGTCITDNQYADVTGGDLLPEMIFGRMAAETEAQMAVLVSKFLEYETQPCMEPSFYQNPITALGWQTSRWFQICSEAVGGYWRNMGKTPVRVNAIYEGTPGSQWSTAQNSATVVNYFGPNGTGYIPASPTELGGWSGGLASHINNGVNSGAFALQHRDHGYEIGWGEPDYTIPNISGLTNVGKMTYVFTINCTTGKFNHSTPCFGEVFHRYTYQGQNAGCVGFVGPTEVSYSFVNDTYVWGMYDLFDPEFLPTYGPNYGTKLGPHVAYSGNWMPAFGNVSGKYFLYSSSWPYNTGDKNITYQMFTPHSDVFLRLFTEVPRDNNISHAAVTLAGNPNFMISASEGTLIALSTVIDGELEIIATAVATGAMQMMTIPSTLIPATEINIVVTGQNYKRYETVVMVVPAEGPYIVPTGYTVENDAILTYISENSVISVDLKNVGVETTNVLNVTIVSNDPKLTITQDNASCEGIAPDETKTVNFKVSVANDIPNNKIFSTDVIVSENGKSQSWESKLSLKAFAPVFSLKKVLIDDVEDGSLQKGALVKITTVVENKGGADAYAVIGELEFNDPYITIACGDDTKRSGSNNLPAGESLNLDFFIITSPNMPTGYEANINILLNAMYELSYSKSFKIINSGTGNYCPSGSQDCSDGDKFTSVIFYKTSEPTILLINNTNTTCNSGGYSDFTNTSVTLEPGQQYTIKVKCGYNSQHVRGWIDLNGNNVFDSNEMLISITCSSSNTEYQQTFTIPQDFAPGAQRFRLITRYNSAPIACNNGNYGQTHEYTVIFPELYPRVQNVNATLTDKNITVIWDAPAEGTPEGYNIFRNKIKLNTTPLTETSFTEENLPEGIYAYNVTAVYTGNKESFAEMSNVICFFLVCEKPVNLQGDVEGKNVFLSWEDSENIEGKLLGYNVYRDEVKINENIVLDKEYIDNNLASGAYIYKVSAIYEHCEESELIEGIILIICEPPTTISVVPESYAIFITWEEPESKEGELLGYNLYRDEKIINEELLVENEYLDEELPNGTYIYNVSAVYVHCDESELSESVEIVYVGIKNIHNTSIKIYPNPTTGKFRILSSEFRVVNVEIFDVYGKSVLKLESRNSNPETIINVSYLQSGIYFVKIYSETNQIEVKRLVVIK
jgi:hypothetical protein